MKTSKPSADTIAQTPTTLSVRVINGGTSASEVLCANTHARQIDGGGWKPAGLTVAPDLTTVFKFTR